jgi:phage-related protein
MASFFGSEFIFDGVPSSAYDLRILDFSSSGGVTNGPMGSDATIVQKQIFRRSRPYFYGRSTNVNLEFDITVGSLDPLSSMNRSAIESWLIGRMNYLPLQIVQSDMSNVTFNVIFNKGTNAYVGSVNRGMTLHAYCQDPWGYEASKTLTKTYANNIINDTFTFYNGSADSDYLKPVISFNMNAASTSIAITNITDNGRITQFDNLLSWEVITMDSNRGTIASNTGLMRMANFTSKKFFRLVPGLNTINILGGVYSFVMTYQFAKKIGA